MKRQKNGGFPGFSEKDQIGLEHEAFYLTLFLLSLHLYCCNCHGRQMNKSEQCFE